MRLSHFSIDLAAFMSGVTLMAAELAGFRSLAPHLGGSIAVTSALVGVILGSLSIGALVGGRLIDRRPSGSVLVAALVGASVSIIVIPHLTGLIVPRIADAVPSLELASLLSAAVLFAVPTALLGSIVPVCARLTPRSTDGLGSAVGRISAVSSAGCIVGTLGAGFILLPYLGIRLTYMSAALVLLVPALLLPFGSALVRSGTTLLLLALACLPIAADSGALIQVDSLYAHIEVHDRWNRGHTRELRTLRTDPFSLQGARYLGSAAPASNGTDLDPFARYPTPLADESETLAVPYTRFFRIGGALCRPPCRALMIGGGVLSYAREFVDTYPRATMEVVEIDATMPLLAERYFDASASDRLSIHIEDGRRFVSRTDRQYDMIILDAFTSAQSVPHHLLSQEAFQIFAQHLAPGGVVVMNILSALEGPRGKLLAGCLGTLRTLFPEVVVFAVGSPHQEREVQNLVLIAGDASLAARLEAISLPGRDRYLAHQALVPASTAAPIFTDDSLLAERYAREIVQVLQRGYIG